MSIDRALVWLCLALAGCAGNGGPKELMPVNAQCSLTRDTCLMGTPADTGDTSSPYTWTCHGRYGGGSDMCSVATASLESDEVVAGQNSLVSRIKATGPLRGRLGILDWTARPGYDGHPHWRVMERLALQTGIPAENRVVIAETPPEFLSLYRDSPQERHLEFRDVPVIAAPVGWARDVGEREPEMIAGLDKLFVTAAGNSCENQVPCDGRLWYPDSNWFTDKPDRWRNAFDAFATGKLIIARYALRNSHDGRTLAAGNETALCGHAMEYCYSLLYNDNLGELHTSGASVRLGAIAFYLFQLWDTPAEVVETLNVCIEDVGAPGPDEEFGRGIVSLVCDRVQTREVRTAVESLSSYGVSPVVGQMLTDGQPRFYPPTTSLSLPALKLRPFFAFNRYNMAGHLGAQFAVRDTDLFVAGGADYAPLGLRSSLIPLTRSAFVELGSRTGAYRGLSALSTYGYSKNEHVTAHMANLGIRYGHTFNDTATLALHAGYSTVFGVMGIPGYREAGAAKANFVKGHPEIRFFLAIGD